MSPSAERVLRTVYARQIADGTPFFATDLETAELAKVAANAYLATKVSFINAMAEVCEGRRRKCLFAIPDPRR
jgi:UDPglucose 6-dehydrogenase